MYAFAIMTLLGLGALVVMRVFNRYVSLATEFQALTLLAISIGGAWLVNLSLFMAWGMPVRWAWVGTTLTGVIVAGVAYFWGIILDFFGGFARKAVDEAEKLEKTEGLRRVA